MANAPIALNLPSLKFEFAEFGHLPLYNHDLDGENPPAAWVSFRQQIRSTGAFLFVMPEYNLSVPGAFGANHHLRQPLVFLNVPEMQQPEATIGGAVNSSMPAEN